MPSAAVVGKSGPVVSGSSCPFTPAGNVKTAVLITIVLITVVLITAHQCSRASEKKHLTGRARQKERLVRLFVASCSDPGGSESGARAGPAPVTRFSSTAS